MHSRVRPLHLFVVLAVGALSFAVVFLFMPELSHEMFGISFKTRKDWSGDKEMSSLVDGKKSVAETLVDSGASMIEKGASVSLGAIKLLLDNAQTVKRDAKPSDS